MKWFKVLYKEHFKQSKRLKMFLSNKIKGYLTFAKVNYFPIYVRVFVPSRLFCHATRPSGENGVLTVNPSITCSVTVLFLIMSLKAFEMYNYSKSKKITPN